MAYLELAMVRNTLYADKVNADALETLYYVKKEVSAKTDDIFKFMLGVIYLAEIDIEKGHYRLAGYDIDLIHNFPREHVADWKEDVFSFPISRSGMQTKTSIFQQV